MIINHNISAINANRILNLKTLEVNKSIEKLSSGLRINRAADDASGLAVSEKLRAQIRGILQAQRNTEDDISFIQTTEGYLQEIQEILHRIRELAVQAANGVYTEEDRMYIQVEVSALISEIDRIASQAQFNEINMLTGKFARPGAANKVTASMIFHIGPNMDQRIRVYISTMTSQALGLKNPVGEANWATFISLSTVDSANANIGLIDEALKKVAKQRADLGAYQNRLEYALKGLMITGENMQAAESRIRDTNMAAEIVKFTKNNIIQQAANAMLAQANALPRMVLQLLR